jgi:PAS domain S-box-containing protein
MMKNRVTFLASLGISLWILDALFETLASPNVSFINSLVLGVPIDRMLFRIAIIAALTVAGIILARDSLSRDLKIKELKKSEDKYASLLNNLPVGVYRITPDGKILEANRQFAEILGYQEPEELKNVNLNSLYVNKLDRHTQLERLRESSVFAEFELRQKDGGTVWVRDYPKATLRPDRTIDCIDGVCVETRGLDAIVRGITEHKRLQSMKDQLLVAVTHELRTPLVSIKGYIDLILSKEADLSKSLRSEIEIVKRNVDRLLNLTNDLLNVQDFEAGRMELKFETLNLHEPLAQCIEEMQPLLREKKQEIRLEIPARPLPIVGDRLRLNEALTNLLTNANKFAPPGGSIIIRVEEDETTATISVTDDGIGIDKKDLQRVFEPFAAIEKPSYFKGSGLGLSLAKKLVEAQGGKIWATSPGKGLGATFAFTLPKSREQWVTING